jgi:hypothetical protein
LTVQVVTAIFGVVLVAAALFGGFRARDIELPSLPLPGRVLSGVVGVAFICLSFWAELRSPSDPAASFPPVQDTTTTTRGTADQPSPTTVAAPGEVEVEVRRADGRSGPLGRDVQLVGHIRGLSKPRSCYWGGWQVRAGDGWTGRFVKGELPLAPDGSFRLTGLQMGGEGETTSEWRPFILGADPDGCALLRQNLEDTQIGSYRGPWPPSGADLLRLGDPVRRAE